jgi:hypothetical protein
VVNRERLFPLFDFEFMAIDLLKQRSALALLLPFRLGEFRASRRHPESLVPAGLALA